MQYRIFFAVVTLSVAFITGCGGGGGGGDGAPVAPAPPAGPVVSTLAFSLRAAVIKSIANADSATLIANGTAATEAKDGLCSGTFNYNTAPATGGATFLGVSALSAVTVQTTSWTNCTPASSSTTGTTYYDTNYLPIGYISQTGKVGVYAGVFSLPLTVSVGDVGILWTENYYTDSSKAVPDGRRDISYVVEAETADTVVVNLISKYYNPYVSGDLAKDGKLRLTTQERSRLTKAGDFVSVSVDLQTYDTGFRMLTDPSNAHHYVFRK